MCAEAGVSILVPSKISGFGSQGGGGGGSGPEKNRQKNQNSRILSIFRSVVVFMSRILGIFPSTSPIRPPCPQPGPCWAAVTAVSLSMSDVRGTVQ